MKRLIVCTIFVLSLLLANAQQYPKALLSGDYPDPTILRDGDDFYMTHSPFVYAPGFLIWHSTDLHDWQPLCRAIPEFTGSAMAPDLVKHDGRFYIYYPTHGTNWVSWADNIKGPWSEPINLNVKGIDPSHVVGEDGKRYLFLSEGYVVQLSDDGLSTVGERRKVYDGWEYPSNWKTECMCLESPKLNYHNGYYYMTSAQGGTAGPPTSHMVVAARSKSIFGPWEHSPYNPIVHTYKAEDNWWSKGHGTIIDDTDGNWWIVYHAYANGYHTLGRQTLIEPITWTSDGWYRPGYTPTIPARTKREAKNRLTLSDDFSGSRLGLQWTFWNENATKYIEIKDHTLTVEGKGTSPRDGRLMLVTPTHKNYITQVEVNVGRNSTAGLLLYYREKAFAGVVSDGRKFTVYKNAEEKVEVPNRFGKRFFVKLHNQGQNLSIYVSKDGSDWTLLEHLLDVSHMNHNKYMGFYALRPALVSIGKGKAAFRDFRYRDGVRTENEMAAYLMVYHKDETHGLHMSVSRDGYTFKALNGGDPVIAGDTIAEQRGIRDPHIMRGPDGAFYMPMTDLHIYAQEEGYRNTKWERDGKLHGWGNNRGIVLMKSWDLLNWKRTNIRIDKLSASLKDISCAWAPATIFDPEKGKLMLYFSIRYPGLNHQTHYVYVNDDFDTIESLPVRLHEHPDGKSVSGDADITELPARMFDPDAPEDKKCYVMVHTPAYIHMSVSDRVSGGYQFSPRRIDFEPKTCEAPHIWKRIGQDKWVLMYDIFSIKPHNFGFAETSDFQTFDDLGHFNEGVMKYEGSNLAPKHGAVVQITQEEADRLEDYWQNNPKPAKKK